MASDRSPKHINEGMNEVTDSAPPPTPEEIRVAAPPDLFYVRNDTLVGNPLLALGKVLYEVEGENSPQTFVYRLNVEPRPDTILKTPQARQELLIKKSAAVNISMLSMLSAEGSAEDVFEFRVIDNSAGALDTATEDFDASLARWRERPDAQALYGNPRVGRISLVIGVVQKYVSTKYYRKYSAEAKGSGWGVNVGGELYMSSSNYRLDIVYGLDLVVLREATINGASANAAAAERMSITAKDHPELAEGLAAFSGDEKAVQLLFAD